MSAPATGWRQRVSEIEDRIMRNEVSAEWVFTQMRQLIAAPSPTDWPSEEAVERAAKAAWAAEGNPAAWWDHAPEWAATVQRYRAMARAALAAAPSPQVESGWRYLEPGEVMQAGDEIWDADDADWTPTHTRWGPGAIVDRNDPPIRRRFALPPVAATGAQEAVAWQYRSRGVKNDWAGWLTCNASLYEELSRDKRYEVRPLYAAPPPSSGSTAQGDAVERVARAIAAVEHRKGYGDLHADERESAWGLYVADAEAAIAALNGEKA